MCIRIGVSGIYYCYCGDLLRKRKKIVIKLLHWQWRLYATYENANADVDYVISLYILWYVLLFILHLRFWVWMRNVTQVVRYSTHTPGSLLIKSASMYVAGNSYIYREICIFKIGSTLSFSANTYRQLLY